VDVVGEFLRGSGGNRPIPNPIPMFCPGSDLMAEEPCRKSWFDGSHRCAPSVPTFTEFMQPPSSVPPLWSYFAKEGSSETVGSIPGDSPDKLGRLGRLPGTPPRAIPDTLGSIPSGVRAGAGELIALIAPEPGRTVDPGKGMEPNGWPC
jgi:hypothetical protein